MGSFKSSSLMTFVKDPRERLVNVLLNTLSSESWNYGSKPTLSLLVIYNGPTV